jgi:hypothetical protein
MHILHIRKFFACTLCTLYNTITGDQGLRYVHTTHTSYNFTRILYLGSEKCQYHRQISAYSASYWPQTTVSDQPLQAIATRPSLLWVKSLITTCKTEPSLRAFHTYEVISLGSSLCGPIRLHTYNSHIPCGVWRGDMQWCTLPRQYAKWNNLSHEWNATMSTRLWRLAQVPHLIA